MEEILKGATFIILYGVSYGVVLFTISIGLVVTMSLMRVANLAHGLFGAIGAYATVSLMNSYGIPFPLALIIAVLGATVLSVVIERIFYTKLYGAPELDQVLMTIGIMFIGIATLNVIFGPNTLNSSLPPALKASVSLGTTNIQIYRLVIVAVGAVLMLGLWLLFDKTSFGARLRAAVDNRGMAEAIGIDVRRLFSIAFALGSALAALGGGLGYAILQPEPLYPFKYLVLILLVVSLCALVSFKASAGISILVGLIDTAGRFLMPEIGSFLVYMVVLVALAWLSPPLMLARRDAMMVARSDLLARHRIRYGELIFWALPIAAYFLFPNDLAFASTVFVIALFALSLDLVLGFAGVVNIGHAVFFGTGAYLAGFIALGGLHEAISGALLAGLACGLLAVVLGPIVLRLAGLPQLMVTLVIASLFYEAANKANSITGGDDGLGGFKIDPLFGVFPWSAYGHTAYLYALGWLVLGFIVSRFVVSSSFGVALQGVRENPQRMRLIGAPVGWHLLRIYVVSAFLAGIAGAVSAQTTRFVALEVLSLDKSVQGLVNLVLGGIGRLYGGLIGTPVYMLVHHIAAAWNPFHWLFVIGVLLLVVVRVARGGILGILEKLLVATLAKARK